MNFTEKLLAAPPLFQTMAVLGREQCLRRIEVAIDRLPKPEIKLGNE